jgi:hypothetical protein
MTVTYAFVINVLIGEEIPYITYGSLFLGWHLQMQGQP